MVKIGNIELGEFPIILAPLENVTDPPFRLLCKHYGADLMFTEFISSEGLIRDAVKSVKKLEFENLERPIGIQIFGHDVDSMIRATELAEKANPDIIDINFGCPVKKVVGKGAGAAMLKNIPLMIKMTEAVVNSTSIPVTVKTRLGWDETDKPIVELAERLQDTGIKALSIHGRTRAQLYKGIADWTLIGEVMKNPRMKIPVFGNGDVDSPEKALEMKQKYKVDGIMIGRAAMGNPWLFRKVKHFLNTGEILPEPDINEKVDVCLKHLEYSIKWKGEKLSITETRKHYSSYLKGIPNIKPYRIKLLTAPELSEVYEILEEIRRNFSGN
ncbi:MAG: tRNA dihydrouridine synthase DusB [Saprospiraceae bacterium]|nr:tRNA dihydrouridine synthase DusB [Saprospiraceae bacterium]